MTVSPDNGRVQPRRARAADAIYYPSSLEHVAVHEAAHTPACSYFACSYFGAKIISRLDRGRESVVFDADEASGEARMMFRGKMVELLSLRFANRTGDKLRSALNRHRPPSGAIHSTVH